MAGQSDLFYGWVRHNAVGPYATVEGKEWVAVCTAKSLELCWELLRGYPAGDGAKMALPKGLGPERMLAEEGHASRSES